MARKSDIAATAITRSADQSRTTADWRVRLSLGRPCTWDGQSHFKFGRLWLGLKLLPDGDAPKSPLSTVAALMPIGKQNPTYPSFLFRPVHQEGRNGYRE